MCGAERDGLTATEIRQFCASRLAAHKIPRTIVWLERIPLTERGKTDRAKLEALVREQLTDGRERCAIVRDACSASGSISIGMPCELLPGRSIG